ncbi:MAG: hypothetical protein JXB39_02300 [Deltaproteobacteria bacterium]|nr:hypothetical protein [Deltaproteobacteria bacterium]
MTRVRGRDRRGQAAVLVALVLFTLVLLMALSTRLGILVTDRIRVQNATDLATYAVAYREAQVLNELAARNRAIAWKVAECRARLVAGVWNECNCLPQDARAEATIDRCVLEIDDRIRAFLEAAEYGRSVEPALAAGRATARENLAGFGFSVSFMEHLSGSPTRRGTFRTVSNLGTVDTIADFEQASVVLNYMHVIECPVCDGACCVTGVAFPQRQVAAWFWKRNAGPEIWVEGRIRGTPLERSPNVAVTEDSSGDDALWSYAVAKPFEGSVGPSQLPPADRNGEWRAGPLYVPGLAALPDPALGMIDEYRARMAGIHEGFSGRTTPAALIDAEGHWDASRFHH